MQRGVFAASFALGSALALSQPARADEGGASFWLPGLFGSLAAAPQQPGWSVATMYYHTSVDAGGDVAFARQVTRGNITTNFRGNLSANLDVDGDLAIVIPTYVFARPVFGGQLSVSMMGVAGRNEASVDTTLTGLGPLGLSLSRGRLPDSSIPVENARSSYGQSPNVAATMIANLCLASLHRSFMARRDREPQAS